MRRTTREIERVRRWLLAAAVLLTLAILLAVLAGIASAQTPCGFAGDPPAPWYSQDGDGNPRPCPPDPGTPPTPLPATPEPPPDYPARSVLIPMLKGATP
jgi:hypothetical protein